MSRALRSSLVVARAQACPAGIRLPFLVGSRVEAFAKRSPCCLLSIATLRQVALPPEMVTGTVGGLLIETDLLDRRG